MTGNSIRQQQNNIFQTLHREPRLSDRVMIEIERMIVGGPLEPGDRLPPERELARQFGVSRTVIREAVRTVAAKGLLEVRAGSGTIISTPKSEDVAHSISLLMRAGRTPIEIPQVLEVRRLLEVEIAGLAAERRTDDDLKILSQILRDAGSYESDPDFFVKSDIIFHNGLAQATHNPVYVLLLESLADIMVQFREIGFRLPKTPRQVMEQHQQIFECIQAANIDAARQAMAHHLTRAERAMQRGLAVQQQPPDR